MISQGLLGIPYRRRDSNPQGLAPSRFWVCRVYHSTTSAFWLPVCQRTTVFVSTIPLYFKECLLKNVLKLFSQILYARWDSNPQPRRARLLRPLCMPIPPLTHIFKERLAGRQGVEPWTSGLEPQMLNHYTNDPYLHVLKDSNPRGPCDPNGFGDHLFQPLTQARII